MFIRWAREWQVVKRHFLFFHTANSFSDKRFFDTIRPQKLVGTALLHLFPTKSLTSASLPGVVGSVFTFSTSSSSSLSMIRLPPFLRNSFTGESLSLGGEWFFCFSGLFVLLQKGEHCTIIIIFIGQIGFKFSLRVSESPYTVGGGRSGGWGGTTADYRGRLQFLLPNTFMNLFQK